jgi:hypothetical protein
MDDAVVSFSPMINIRLLRVKRASSALVIGECAADLKGERAALKLAVDCDTGVQHSMAKAVGVSPSTVGASEAQRWLKRQPAFHMHFTPTSSS